MTQSGQWPVAGGQGVCALRPRWLSPSFTGTMERKRQKVAAKTPWPPTTGHRPPILLLALILGSGLTLACQSTAPEDLPEPVPVAQTAPRPDPRVAEMQVLIAELLDRIEVLNARLQRLESGAPQPALSSTTRPPSTPPSTTRTASAPAVTPVPTRSTASRSLTGAALDAKYRAALAAFGKGEIDQSRKLFQEVLDSDPAGDLADNALYWIAETYFVTGKYPEAMETYRQILKDHSDENKAPDAMLKLGLAYVKLGDLALAKTTFEQLIQKYPYSTPASTAKLEIKRIQY